MSIVDKKLYLHDEQDSEELFCQFTSLFGFHLTLKFFSGGLITFLLYPGLQFEILLNEHRVNKFRRKKAGV